MVVCHTIGEIKKFLSTEKGRAKTTGFVPTMGALHEGHLRLIQAARADNDMVISSIFVNPAQFNNLKDFEKYPRDIDSDIELMTTNHCDAVFIPGVKEMYKEEAIVQMSFGSYETGLEGAFRPGHFNGVGIVLSKFFNIIQPDKAYFGQKDLQQAAIVSKLCEDLHFEINIVVVPTVREKDGLAYSSRNRRLDSHQRKMASKFYSALKMAQKNLLLSQSIDEVTNQVKSFIDSEDQMSLEYFSVVNSNTMELVEQVNLEEKISLCIAGYVGEVRLLDNIYLKDGQ